MHLQDIKDEECSREGTLESLEVKDHKNDEVIEENQEGAPASPSSILKSRSVSKKLLDQPLFAPERCEMLAEGENNGLSAGSSKKEENSSIKSNQKEEFLTKSVIEQIKEEDIYCGIQKLKDDLEMDENLS